MKWFKYLLLALFVSCASLGLYQHELPHHTRGPASEELVLNADDPLEKPEDLTKTFEVNSVKRIDGAKIVYVDYELIRRDFPAVKNLSNPEIDDWLLNNTAYMAETQVSQENANSSIRVTDETRVAYRPEDYGRALIFQAEPPEGLSPGQQATKEFMAEVSGLVDSGVFQSIDGSKKEKLLGLLEVMKEGDSEAFIIAQNLANEMFSWREGILGSHQEKNFKLYFDSLEKQSRTFIGLIDAKGVGAVRPRAGDHSDGLMTLGEAIREFTYEKMVNRIFMHEGSGLKTVGSYAVIDGGYAVKHADGSSSPAGIILRQAHARDPGPSSTMGDEITLRVEKVLRRYGLTSAGAYRDKYSYDKLNVQGTNRGAVIDFGGFLAVEDFGGRDAQHFFRSKVLYQDKGPNRIKPDPSLRVPLEQWGSAVPGKEDPKMDKPWMWSHELARSFSEGRANRDDAYNHLRNMWGPFFDKLERAPRPGPQGCHDLLRSLLR